MTNAKPKSNLAKMWGNVLSKDYEKKESKKNNEYRISLYGKISEKTEEINDIAEEGKDILIATDEIDKAEEFYKINGNDEEVAKEKAKSYGYVSFQWTKPSRSSDICGKKNIRKRILGKTQRSKKSR